MVVVSSEVVELGGSVVEVVVDEVVAVPGRVVDVVASELPGVVGAGWAPAGIGRMRVAMSATAIALVTQGAPIRRPVGRRRTPRRSVPDLGDEMVREIMATDQGRAPAPNCPGGDEQRIEVVLTSMAQVHR